MEDVNKFTKEDAVEWLRNIGQACSGTKDELIIRIKKYLRWPSMLEKFKKKTEDNYSFPCSLGPSNIPPIEASWVSNYELYPKVSTEIFKRYASQKNEGSKGQQDKAFRMLQSRKIISVKVCQDGNSSIFVKAMVKKSYGHVARPAVIHFVNGYPFKSHCNCPVGSSGLCCHILATLLFLKHFGDTGEKILELTCTEQMQRWHRRIGKGSIPMIPLKDIKVKSSKRKKDFKIEPADPQNSSFKRDISSMIKQLNKKLDSEKPVTEHVYSVLTQSEVGKKSSVGEHLNFAFKLNQLGDHQYISTKDFETYVLSHTR